MPLDWSDYERVHATRRNLAIHMFAVPFFDIAFPAALIFLIAGDYVAATASLAGIIASMALQGSGHAREAIAPEPFKGPLDFVRRWFSEQYLKFPLFVMSGRWWRQYHAASS